MHHELNKYFESLNLYAFLILWYKERGLIGDHQ